MNPHLNYLLKRFDEERTAIRDRLLSLRCEPIEKQRAVTRTLDNLDEIEFQIRRAFDDQEKEQQKTSSTLDRV